MKPKLTALILLLSSWLLLLTGCQKQPTQSKGITVVTSLDFYAETAKAVLGNHGQVITLINQPNMDPHDFEPTTATAKTVAKGQIVISNGLGYDSWLQRLLTANGKSHITNLRVGEDLWHKKEGTNEHLWYDYRTMPKLARRLAKLYSQRDPKHRQAYEANAKAYIRSLKPINRKITALRAQSNHQKVAVSEPVFNYALTAMGYKISNQHFAKAIEDGTDPSPQDIQKLRTAIRQHKIAFFVQNTQADSKVITNLVKLAKQQHVPVLKVTETLPAHLTYRQWMLQQYQQVARIQKGSAHD